MNDGWTIGGGMREEGPAMLLLLGLCPAMAVSVRVIDALWMSAGVACVLALSSLGMSLIARLGGSSRAGTGSEPSLGSALSALLVSSFLTASFELLLMAVAPETGASLGIYAPLIAVNCLVLGRARAAAGSLSVGGTLADAVVRGIGFAACLILIAALREAAGAGTITLFPVGAFGGVVAIPSLVDDPVRALGFAGGGLLCLGYLAALLRAAGRRKLKTDAAAAAVKDAAP
jgi:Na+-translocating ferredoxin:NAD+ oxidoreductase subunit E